MSSMESARLLLKRAEQSIIAEYDADLCLGFLSSVSYVPWNGKAWACVTDAPFNDVLYCKICDKRIVHQILAGTNRCINLGFHSGGGKFLLPVAKRCLVQVWCEDHGLLGVREYRCPLLESPMSNLAQSIMFSYMRANNVIHVSFNCTGHLVLRFECENYINFVVVHSYSRQICNDRFRLFKKKCAKSVVVCSMRCDRLCDGLTFQKSIGCTCHGPRLAVIVTSQLSSANITSPPSCIDDVAHGFFLSS